MPKDKRIEPHEGYEQLDEELTDEELDDEEFNEHFEEEAILLAFGLDEMFGDTRDSLLRVILYHPMIAALFITFFRDYIPTIISGFVSVFYTAAIAGIFTLFKNILDIENWFSYSLSIFFLVNAIIYFISDMITRKRRTSDSNNSRAKAIVDLIIAIAFFLAPGFFLEFFFGAAGLLAVMVGLYNFIKRTNTISSRLLGLVLLLLGIALFVLPRYSVLYYQIYIAVLIGILGLIQIVLGFVFRRIYLLELSDEVGFEDYSIE